jgi:hypothetical protein
VAWPDPHSVVEWGYFIAQYDFSVTESFHAVKECGYSVTKCGYSVTESFH